MDIAAAPQAGFPFEAAPAAHTVSQAIARSPITEIDLERARQDERTALAREMHDEIGGTLGALKLMLVALRRQSSAGALADGICQIEDVLDGAMASADRIIRALRPAVLERGVVEALRHETGEFSRRHRVRAQFQSNRNTLELPQGQALTVYRVCQEALSNVARHADASSVSIDLFRDTGSVTLEIVDNGRGFDTSRLSSTARLGVAGMRERARSFGGWVQIDSRPGEGTTVMLKMPLRRVADVTL